MKNLFLGYQLDTLKRADFTLELVSFIKSAKTAGAPYDSKWLACLNPHSYAIALDDPNFAQALHKATWLIPDGIGVVWGGRLLGLEIHERVTGYDIFDGILRGLQGLGGGRVFLLGSTEAVLDSIEMRMAQDYPDVKVSGRYSPPFSMVFSAAENLKIADLVNTAHSDVLLVGLSAPKQEKWIAEMQDHLDVPFIAAIGAVFDFYSGNIRRSSPIFQRFGLEWLPRLLQEPRRLWRRMLISAPRFTLHVLREWALLPR